MLFNSMQQIPDQLCHSRTYHYHEADREPFSLKSISFRLRSPLRQEASELVVTVKASWVRTRPAVRDEGLAESGGFSTEHTQTEGTAKEGKKDEMIMMLKVITENYMADGS